MSSWSTNSSFPYRSGNLSFQSGELTIEFDRTKYAKVFKHFLGIVEFGSKDVNNGRQTAIDSSTLFSVRSVYIPQGLTSSNANGSYNILAHGASSQAGDKENCSAVGMTCSDGNGSNTLCNAGKCLSGRLSRVSETRSDGTTRVSPRKWRFLSDTDDYYVFQEDGLITLNHNRQGTSRHTKFYVPPISYLEGDVYIRSLLKNFSYYELIGGEDKKDRFIAEGVKRSSYYSTDGIPVQDYVLEDLSVLGEPWYSMAQAEVETSRASYFYDQDFLADVYDKLSILFSKAIQITPSSFKQASVDYFKSEISRPIYSRLPGTSGAYNSIDNGETVSKWLVAGADEVLSKSQSRVANFYRDYLDPDTCYPLALDWLAQHIGMFGPLWDKNWSTEIKRGMIKNAFGWWDREVNGVNHKSKVLGEFPFTQSNVWTSDPEVISDQGGLILSEIEKFFVTSGGVISYSGKYTAHNVITEDGVSSIEPSEINHPKFLSSDWNGMIESKGGLLTLVFLASLFGLKSHVPTELEVIDLATGQFRPKTGLRSVEVQAPILLPFKHELCQVGSDDDLRTGNFPNQLVVGMSRVNDIENTKNVIFRVPYYYNRGGKSWSKVEYIARNWLPADVNSKVQYPYLSADLWAVGDAFFEPEYEIA